MWKPWAAHHGAARRPRSGLEFVVAEGGVVLFDCCGACCEVKTGRRVLEGQAQFNQLCLDLVNGLGTEVADVHQVSLGAGNEFTHGVDALTLEAVVGTDGEVQILDRQCHVGCQGSCGVQLTGQTEQFHQGGACGSNGIARGDGLLGLDVDNQLVEVGALLNTGCFHAESNLQHRRVDGVNRDTADLCVAGLVLSCRNVAAAALDGQFEFELALRVQRGNVQIRVVELDAGRRSDVRGGDDSGALLAQVSNNRLVVLGRHGQVLDVEDDLSDIFLDTRNRRELVQHAIDPDAGYSGTGDGGEQGTAEGVSEGVTEARLQRFNDEPGAVFGDDLFGEGGALCNEHLGFLSASIRYMTQHRWWKDRSGDLTRLGLPGPARSGQAPVRS